MYGLVVRFDLRDEDSARGFDDLVAETAAEIRAREPGTVVYVTHRVADEPLTRVFYEMYRDHDAFEEHQRQPHVQRFLRERERYLAARRVEFLTPDTVKGFPAQP